MNRFAVDPVQSFPPAERELLLLARESSLRHTFKRLFSWAMMLIVPSYVFIHMVDRSEIAYPILRIILVDYAIFVGAWYFAWRKASLWRTQPGLLHELAVTPIDPAVVASLLSVGPLAVWKRCLFVAAAIELLVHFATIYFNGLPHPIAPFAWLGMVAILPFFHLESVRIAHGIFAVTALPGLSLPRRAATGLVSISLFTVALTVVGSMMTGVVAGMLLVGEASAGAWYSGFFDDPISPGFYIASIFPLVAIAYLKRVIANSYERRFAIRWICYIATGAASSEHPDRYPKQLDAAAANYNDYLRSAIRPTRG